MYVLLCIQYARILLSFTDEPVSGTELHKALNKCQSLGPCIANMRNNLEIWKAQNKQNKKRKETGGKLEGLGKEDEEQDEFKAKEVADNAKESKENLDVAVAIVSPLAKH